MLTHPAGGQRRKLAIVIAVGDIYVLDFVINVGMFYLRYGGGEDWTC